MLNPYKLRVFYRLEIQKRSHILESVKRSPILLNDLIKKSIPDCLQTRPIDRRFRLIQIRGELESKIILEVDEPLKIVLAL
jgi:mRNA interferase MazF